MKNENNASAKKRSNKKIGILDVVIIVAAITLTLGLFGRMYIGKRIGVSYEDSAEVTFIIEGISKDGSEAIVKGDVLTWVKYDDSGEANDYMRLGEIKSFTSRSASVVMGEDEGSYSVTDETKVDVVCTLTADGKKTDSGFMLGGTQYIAAGMKIPVRCPHYSVNILILGVEAADVK